MTTIKNLPPDTRTQEEKERDAKVFAQVLAEMAAEGMITFINDDEEE